MLQNYIVETVVQFYEYTKNYQDAYLKLVNFMLCKFKGDCGNGVIMLIHPNPLITHFMWVNCTLYILHLT